MNRLWMRFSIIISGLCLLIIPIWILIEQLDPVISSSGIIVDDEVGFARLTTELAETMLMVSTIAVLLGVLLSRWMSAPIVGLSQAAKQIGSGDLGQRVPVQNHSQELDDLALTFNRMAADLEHAETLRQNMLADISHELRTPLTVLSGQLHAALDKVYALDEEALANLYGQTQHLIHLVDDLRLLAQAEARRLPLATGEVQLAELWRELAANFSLVAAEQGIQFRVEPMEMLPPISADPGRLRQIFSNLLANAIRHTPDGGDVVVSSKLEGEMVVITIRDSGEGITLEQLPQLFDRFYRADSSRTRDTGGSGLGLAIVKALVEMHGGTVSAESDGPSQGSSFTVSLPLQLSH